MIIEVLVPPPPTEIDPITSVPPILRILSSALAVSTYEKLPAEDADTTNMIMLVYGVNLVGSMRINSLSPKPWLMAVLMSPEW
jgi:hypothetical protein